MFFKDKWFILWLKIWFAKRKNKILEKNISIKLGDFLFLSGKKLYIYDECIDVFLFV